MRRAAGMEFGYERMVGNEKAKVSYLPKDLSLPIHPPQTCRSLPLSNQALRLRALRQEFCLPPHPAQARGAGAQPYECGAVASHGNPATYYSASVLSGSRHQAFEWPDLSWPRLLSAVTLIRVLGLSTSRSSKVL